MRPASCAKALFAILAASLLAAPTTKAQREKLPPDDLAYVEQHWPQAKKISTGIRYIVEREGTGKVAEPGDTVSVLYVGRLLRGTIFDQELDRKRPFIVHVRQGEVIEGWDEILQFMKLGEKRLVIIPPELAYGARGEPPKIPRDATLVFDMEIVGLVRAPKL